MTSGTIKQLRQKTRPAAKAPRLRARARSELQEKLTEVTHELTEVTRHRSAISDMLRAIVSSPHDLQPIFDTIVDSAIRLCRANASGLRLQEEEGFRLVALKGDPDVIDQWAPPILVGPGSFISQLARGGSPAHIPNLTDEVYYQRDPAVITALKSQGFRTALIVPMVKDNDVIGMINLGRTRMQPFTDKQIELITDFAAQAAIALEMTRRERLYREVQNELAHANRVLTMGQITASIAHELRQPLGAALNDGKASLNWLTRCPPEVEEAKLCLEEVIKDINRASDVIDRIHRLLKKDTLRIEKLDINGAILEVIGLIHNEVLKNGVTVGTELVETLPPVQGDRVQLQQVILNLLINAIQAMGDLADGQRELHVSTAPIKSEGVLVAVRDTGPGLRPKDLERLFVPFHTTKPNGMGMGLSICRSIIEGHGGRLWATRHDPRGALFQFTIPATSGGS
jgi:C4-dicarboxylate-specific signal transduction histidine kinase